MNRQPARGRAELAAQLEAAVHVGAEADVDDGELRQAGR
jgi:hypothetical protein